MSKHYLMSGLKISKRFVCIEDCEHQFSESCEKYLFKKGEVFDYQYEKRKFNVAIYNSKGKYNGSVRFTFVDKYFLPEEDFLTLQKVDSWFDSLLHSNIKIKKIKKIDGVIAAENENTY